MPQRPDAGKIVVTVAVLVFALAAGGVAAWAMAGATAAGSAVVARFVVALPTVGFLAAAAGFAGGRLLDRR